MSRWAPFAVAVDALHELAEHAGRVLVGDLAGAGRLVAAPAIGEHQLTDVRPRAAVDDRLAGREHGVLLLEAPQHVDRDVALGEHRVDREAVRGVDDLLVAEVEHHEVAVHGGAAADLRGGPVGVLEVELHALGHVRQLEDLLDAQRGADVDQLHHELVVGDPELAEAAEARARIHEEVEQRPAGRLEDLLERELGGVALVDGLHQLADAGERRLGPEVLVDHAGGGLRAGHDHVVARPALDPDRLRVMVVERDVHARVVGKIGGDVAGAELDLSVLHVLRVDELDVVEHAEVLEEGGAHQPVEVAARHESEALCLKLRHGINIGKVWGCHDPIRALPGPRGRRRRRLRRRGQLLDRRVRG
jgi:hypothetical protein